MGNQKFVPTTILSFTLPLLVLLLLASPLSSAELSSVSAKQQAEQLLRGLNLSPKSGANIRAASGAETASSTTDQEKLVEWPLLFSIKNMSAPSVADLGHHAGYYGLPPNNSAKMFYYFFESRSSNKDPVVIWLTGGPGCSSSLALFYENGPYKINNDLSLKLNDFGWDTVSNIIFVDQPVGTGFSYTDASDLRHDEQGVSNDLYNFLQAFFKNHPQLATNDFYITGESYAGHYIPALASRINQGNKAKQGIQINLKGFAIGNGLTNPEVQYSAYSEYALQMKLIDQSEHDYINHSYVPLCQAAIQRCGAGDDTGCSSGFELCNNIFTEILSNHTGINYYDIRKQCEGRLCYDFSNLEKFMSLDSVRKALGVGDIEFVSCSTVVYEAMITDWVKNLEVGIPALLDDGIKMLIYAGEYDFICNWLGNWEWVRAMKWSGQQQFNSAPTTQFVVAGKEAGQMTSYGPVIFLKVRNAGHMVPMDQPRAALQMLKRWTQGMLPSKSHGN